MIGRIFIQIQLGSLTRCYVCGKQRQWERKHVFIVQQWRNLSSAFGGTESCYPELNSGGILGLGILLRDSRVSLTSEQVNIAVTPVCTHHALYRPLLSTASPFESFYHFSTSSHPNLNNTAVSVIKDEQIIKMKQKISISALNIPWEIAPFLVEDIFILILYFIFS